MSLKNGVVPVMLTPFNEDESIDYPSLGKLIEWYINQGASGLFAVCQSSEMIQLSDQEAQDVARFVVKQTDGRIPVVASGHTADSIEDQKKQMMEMAATGVDGIVFITNRLGDESATDAEIVEHMEELMQVVPEHVSIGLYECPLPWKRLLSDKLVEYCAKSGRFTFLKDTCCSAEVLARRLAIVNDSNFKIYNANGPTLFESLKIGAAGYSGVMANFHCDLYVWLCNHFDDNDSNVQELSRMLSVASLSEHVVYPAAAKYYQKKLGNFETTVCRTMDHSDFYQGANVDVINHLQSLSELYNSKITTLN